jgi:hypothetical protein
MIINMPTEGRAVFMPRPVRPGPRAANFVRNKKKIIYIFYAFM